MKTKHVFTGLLSLLAAAVALSWPSCTQDDEGDELELKSASSYLGQQVEVATDVGTLLRCAKSDGRTLVSVETPDTVCNLTYKALYAGQSLRIGYVTVANDSRNLYVAYYMYWGSSWVFKETHLYAGSLSDAPLTSSGNPRVGNFPYSATFDPTVKRFGYAIPLSSLGAFGNAGSEIVVLAHAVVLNLDSDNIVVQEETAWAGCDPLVVGNGNWATLVTYTIAQCGDMETYESPSSIFTQKRDKKGKGNGRGHNR